MGEFKMTRFRWRFSLAILVLLILSGVSGTAADAISVSAKPTKPSLTVISAKVRSGKIDISVTFNSAITHRASPILSTQVKVGTLTCTVVGRAKNCKLKGLASKRYKVSARSKNKNGWGPWSAPVSFNATNGRIWRRNPTVPTVPTTTVAAVPTTTLPTVPTTTLPTVPTTTALKFNFKAAIGLAVNQTISSSSVRSSSLQSNLLAIRADGNVTDAISSGKATIRRFLIGPNDKIYLEFSDAPLIDGTPCRLAVVTPESGLPTCVETDTGFVFMGIRQNPTSMCNYLCNRPLRNDLQFDSQGFLYYAGVPGTWKQTFPQAKWVPFCNGDDGLCDISSVIRRKGNGSQRDLGNAFLEAGVYDEVGFELGFGVGAVMIRRPITNFLVMPDGRVLTQQYERIARPDGSCNTAPRCHDVVQFMNLWSSDGSKIAADLPEPPVGLLAPVGTNKALVATQNALEIFDVKTGELARTSLYRTSENSSFGCDQEPYNDSIPSYRKDFKRFFCFSPSLVRHYWKTPNNEVFLIMGHDRLANIEGYNREEAFIKNPGYPEYYKMANDWGGKYGSGILIRAYPNVATTKLGKPTSDEDLSRIEVFTTALDRIFATGLNRRGERQTVMYNTATDTTQILIPVSAKIQTNELGFSTKTNALLFSGVYEDSGKAVSGLVDVTSGKITILSTNSSLNGLQTFGS
jgi:hypothetical protein